MVAGHGDEREKCLDGPFDGGGFGLRKCLQSAGETVESILKSIISIDQIIQSSTERLGGRRRLQGIPQRHLVVRGKKIGFCLNGKGADDYFFPLLIRKQPGVLLT